MKRVPFLNKQVGLFFAIGLLILLVAGCQQRINPSKDTAVSDEITANGLGNDALSFETPEVRTEDREYLLTVYQDTWNYLADFVEPMTGLPYDSNKKQPATSVSNIGLYLGATAIAHRTGLISKEEALSRINAAFTSLKKLETWRGFPQVWAAVRSLKPIHGSETFSYSKHVANLIGGLTLIQTIFPEEFNQEVGSYVRGLGFKGMFDAGTGWVKGGYDLKLQDFAVSQPFGPWHYKFLASEARLISYYLIARGFAPTSHWTSLLRPIQNGNGEWFLVSGLEDGGAYMPYMAGLYVDERQMLMGVSQRNYTQASMRHAKDMASPVWGWSASLDTRGAYVPYGQLRDEIVTPYASMLAVNYFPQEVTANLKALEKMGARPETESQTTTQRYSVFADERSVYVSPYAFVDGGHVFLVDAKGSVYPLKDYLNPASLGQAVDLVSGGGLDLFFKATGEPAYLDKSVQELVQSAARGTGMSESLEKIVGGFEQVRTVLALAARTGDYQFGEVRLKDGTLLKALWVDQQGLWVAKAIAYKDELYILKGAGGYEKLADLWENGGAVEDLSIAGYDRERVAFVAALTGQDNVLSAGGEVLTRANHFSDDALRELNLSSAIAAEIAALAAHVEAYQPAKLRLSNGAEIELALDRIGIKQTPWAVANQGEVYFLNRDGVLETLTPYIKKTSAGKKKFSYDVEALHKLLQGAKLGVPAEELLSQESERGEIAQAPDVFAPELIKGLSRPESLGELQSLAVAAGIYQLGQVHLHNGQNYSVLWSHEDGKNVPWAIASANDVFFVNDQQKIESLKGYLQDSLTPPLFDEFSSRAFFETSGIATRDQKSELIFIDKISPKSETRAQLNHSIESPQKRADLWSLAIKNGMAESGRVRLSDGTEWPVLWADQTLIQQTPWAMADAQQAIFMSPNRRTPESVSAYLDQRRVGQPVQNLDRRTLVVFAEALGFKPQAENNAQDFFKQAVYGTLVKASLRKELRTLVHRQSLLGLAAKAGLYTPAKIELADGSTALVILTRHDDKVAVAAAAKGGEVFFLGKDKRAHPLRDYKSKRMSHDLIAAYDRFPMDLLAAELGYRLHEKELFLDKIQSVKLGTFQSETLVNFLADAEVLPELEALAGLTDVATPSQLLLTDETALWVALLETEGRYVPSATVSSGGNNISFLNREGHSLNLSQYLDNTLVGEKTQAYDRGALKNLLVGAGIPVKGPAPEAVLGTLVKRELMTQVADAQQLRDLLGLAGKADMYKPGSVQMKDVGTVPVLFEKQGETYRPWALAHQADIYFTHQNTIVENLSSKLTRGPQRSIAYGADSQASRFIRGKNSETLSSSFSYQAFQRNQVSPELSNSLSSSEQAGELLGLAASVGAYDPVNVRLIESKMAHYGFRDSVNWKSGKVTPYYLTPSQGMAFLSLANFLYDGVVWKTFSDSPKMKKALEELREIDRTQDLLGGQAQRGCVFLPKTQARAA